MALFEKQPGPAELAKRAAAVEILIANFSEGLTALCDPRFLAKRYDEFLRKDDPIYVELLKGMKNEALAKTFVSYWTIAQTLATKSRFWLEDAVAEIIAGQVQAFGRDPTDVFTHAMLSQGYLEHGVALADVGENCLESLKERGPWRPPMKENALQAVDLVVGEQERERVNRRQRQQVVQRRAWEQGDERAPVQKDRECVKRIAAAVGGRAIADVAIQCNLLAVVRRRKDGGPEVLAFRFINPKTIASHAQRKQERVNLLRLYAYLVQEEVFQDPASIQVCVAELLPRHAGGFDRYDYYPDYFSSYTYWSSERLWEFIGVPFDVVSEAIRNVAQRFREQLIEGLRFLLPDSKPPEGWGSPRRRGR